MNNPHEDGPPEATDRRGCTAEEAASSLMADHICPECQLIIYDPPRGAMKCWPTAVMAFEKLWDSIYGKPRKDGTDISWSANPWVWVVEFKRVEP